VKSVGFPLREETITTHLLHSRCYASTRYVVLRNGRDTAVVEVEKTESGRVLEEITGIRVLSLPAQTVFVEDGTVDVLNPDSLLQVAKQYAQRSVVVKGKYEHVSFIHGRASIKLRVFDVVPPEPAKLVTMVRQALQVQTHRVPVEVLPDITDLRRLAEVSEADSVIFPCSASEITPGTVGRKVFFLDELSAPPEQAVLVGCNLSLKIFKELFNCTPEFIQMCPAERTSEDLFITKCCELKEGFEVVDGGVVVPWGAEVKDVLEALEVLFELCETSKRGCLYETDCDVA
jgi:hypothetical protein